MNEVPNPPLTKRQKQVLRLLAEGLCPKEVAETLQVSDKVIYYHLNGDCWRSGCSGIFARLGTHSIALLTQWALKNGIAEWKV